MSAVAITNKPVIKVGLVGEIYTLLEPFTSQSIEKRLGTMGFEVERSVYLSQWISDHLFKGLVKGVNSNKEYLRLSTAYLKHTVGGHGQETIGSIMDFTAKGVQGIIQVFPFTCMPEIVAHSILPKMSKDLNIPMMTIIVDEQSGEAGLVTRLEAFGDLLQERNEAKENLA